jgi:hypothetical protein
MLEKDIVHSFMKQSDDPLTALSILVDEKPSAFRMVDLKNLFSLADQGVEMAGWCWQTP